MYDFPKVATLCLTIFLVFRCHLFKFYLKIYFLFNHYYFSFNFYYLYFIHFLNLVESDNGKLQMPYTKLTKYILIIHLKLCGIFLIEYNFLIK